MANTTLIQQLMEAIKSSNKPFDQIDKDSIIKFCQRQGISRGECDKVYNQLAEIYKPKRAKSESTSASSMSISANTGVVDYSDNSHNDVKVRTPRKNVFSEITKIGG